MDNNRLLPNRRGRKEQELIAGLFQQVDMVRAAHVMELSRDE